MLPPTSQPASGLLQPSVTAARLGSGAALVALGGEIDLHTAPRLDNELRTAGLGDGAGAGRQVIVDLTAATFIDSTVLGVLLEARGRLGTSGGSLVLVCQDRRILRTLEVAGLDGLFAIEPTLAEAMAALHDGGLQ